MRVREPRPLTLHSPRSHAATAPHQAHRRRRRGHQQQYFSIWAAAGTGGAQNQFVAYSVADSALAPGSHVKYDCVKASARASAASSRATLLIGLVPAGECGGPVAPVETLPTAVLSFSEKWSVYLYAPRSRRGSRRELWHVHQNRWHRTRLCRRSLCPASASW